MTRGRSNGLVSPLAAMKRRSVEPGNRDRAAETAHPYMFPHGNSALGLTSALS
jgi:hypothetical protein